MTHFNAEARSTTAQSSVFGSIHFLGTFNEVNDPQLLIRQLLSDQLRDTSNRRDEVAANERKMSWKKLFEIVEIAIAFMARLRDPANKCVPPANCRLELVELVNYIQVFWSRRDGGKTHIQGKLPKHSQDIQSISRPIEFIHDELGAFNIEQHRTHFRNKCPKRSQKCGLCFKQAPPMWMHHSKVRRSRSGEAANRSSNPTKGSPCLPPRNAALSKPPAFTERINEVHSKIPLLSNLHSATLFVWHRRQGLSASAKDEAVTSVGSQASNRVAP